ncbi:hypothetical protein EVAR_43730_1 [Eumeta japonica]|uniref:Uncharacterized protein n=1 Tax=Eumeta variegata TaxID=151549 RepID=A0A4C1Y3S2_EUMVA|nr:hypothetical protein EVAR_43730_1 [Eumeta japonica]
MGIVTCNIFTVLNCKVEARTTMNLYNSGLATVKNWLELSCANESDRKELLDPMGWFDIERRALIQKMRDNSLKKRVFTASHTQVKSESHLRRGHFDTKPIRKPNCTQNGYRLWKQHSGDRCRFFGHTSSTLAAPPARRGDGVHPFGREQRLAARGPIRNEHPPLARRLAL